MAILPANCFGPFVSNKHDGMGLGLSISRSIIEAHDGQLIMGAESRGRKHFFALPFRPVERHMATERTVYVLDDDDGRASFAGTPAEFGEFQANHLRPSKRFSDGGKDVQDRLCPVGRFACRA